MSRLKERYDKEVAPALKKEFGYSNVMAIPKLQKIVVNMGLGEATQNAKIVDTGADEVARITGQKPVATRAKKSIAQFKVRKGMPIGVMVTLRGDRMWNFLDRLIVEGVNLIKRHTKPNPQRNVKGGVVEREAALHASNVQIVCPECGKPTRLGKKLLGDGRKVRVCRKCEGVVDI